jgi:hypothetical protein
VVTGRADRWGVDPWVIDRLSRTASLGPW